MNKKNLLISLLAIIWGVNFPISKYVLMDFTPYEVRFISGLLGMVLTLLFLFKFRSEFNRIRSLLLGCVISFPVMAMVPALNVLSLNHINSSTALVIIYIMPAITSVILFIINRDWHHPALLLPAFFAALAVFSLNDFNIRLGAGEIIIIISAIIWSIGNILIGKFKQHSAGVFPFMTQMFFGSMITMVFFDYFIDHQRLMMKLESAGMLRISALLFVCGIASCLAFLFWNNLITHYGAESASYSVLISPVVGVFIGVFISGDAFSLNVITALFFIIISIYTQQKISRRVNREPEKKETIK